MSTKVALIAGAMFAFAMSFVGPSDGSKAAVKVIDAHHVSVFRHHRV